MSGNCRLSEARIRLKMKNKTNRMRHEASATIAGEVIAMRWAQVRRKRIVKFPKEERRVEWSTLERLLRVGHHLSPHEFRHRFDGLFSRSFIRSHLMDFSSHSKLWISNQFEINLMTSSSFTLHTRLSRPKLIESIGVFCGGTMIKKYACTRQFMHHFLRLASASRCLFHSFLSSLLRRSFRRKWFYSFDFLLLWAKAAPLSNGE